MQVNAMLLNEFLKARRIGLNARKSKLKRIPQVCGAELPALQKVSAQLELSRSAPTTVFAQ